MDRRQQNSHAKWFVAAALASVAAAPVPALAQWSPLPAASSARSAGGATPAMASIMVNSVAPSSVMPTGIVRDAATGAPTMPAMPADYASGPAPGPAPGAVSMHAQPAQYAATGLYGATGTFGDEQAAAYCYGGPSGTCSPRQLTYGYFGPVWRRWPEPPSDAAAQAGTPQLPGGAGPVLPDAERETDIYVPPRSAEPIGAGQPEDADMEAEENPSGDASQPRPIPSPELQEENPMDDGSSPPDLPFGLSGGGTRPEPSSSSGWGDLAASLAANDRSTAPRRPITLRRSTSGVAKADPDLVQGASYSRSEQPNRKLGGAEDGPSRERLSDARPTAELNPVRSTPAASRTASTRRFGGNPLR